MLRSIIAVTSGVILGFTIVVFASFIVMQMIPAPQDLDPSDPNILKLLPLQNQLGVAIVWFVGVFVGALAVAFIGRRWAPSVWVLAATMALFAGSNFLQFPAPIWLALVTFAVIGGAGWLAVTLTRARYGAPPAAPKKGL